MAKHTTEWQTEDKRNDQCYAFMYVYMFHPLLVEFGVLFIFSFGFHMAFFLRSSWTSSVRLICLEYRIHNIRTREYSKWNNTKLHNIDSSVVVSFSFFCFFLLLDSRFCHFNSLFGFLVESWEADNGWNEGLIFFVF